MLDFSTISILTIIVIFLSTLSSISGLGGGVFLIPLIVIFFDLPLKNIAGTMLLAMVPFTAVATIRNVKNKYVNLRIGLLVQIGAIIGVLIGAHYSGVLPDHILKILFVMVVFYLLISLQAKDKSEFNLAAQMFRLLNKIPPFFKSDESTRERLSLTALITMGFITGIFSGLLGIGGGFMFVPLFIVGLRLPPKIAVGTSLFMILLTSSVGAIHHGILDHIQYKLAVVLGVGMIIGAAIGSLLLKRIQEKRLTKIIFLILLFAAVGIFLR